MRKHCVGVSAVSGPIVGRTNACLIAGYLSIVSDVSSPLEMSPKEMATAEEPPTLPIYTLFPC